MIIKILFAANIVPIALLMLTGWFAYLENGYWGWPFAFAIMTAQGIKTSKDKFEEEREAAIQKAKDIKKYGNIYNQN